MNRIVLSNADVLDLAMVAARKLIKPETAAVTTVYAIPRGGIAAAYAMRAYANFHMVDDPRDADYIVDDLLESGSTMDTALAQARPFDRACASAVSMVEPDSNRSSTM